MALDGGDEGVPVFNAVAALQAENERHDVHWGHNENGFRCLAFFVVCLEVSCSALRLSGLHRQAQERGGRSDRPEG
jgi:hypothetical protein